MALCPAADGFYGSSSVPVERIEPRSARDSIAAERKGGTRFHVAATARTGQDPVGGRTQGPGVAAQRVGFVVRIMPCGAPVSHATRQKRRRTYLRARLEGPARGCHRVAAEIWRSLQGLGL